MAGQPTWLYYGVCGGGVRDRTDQSELLALLSPHFLSLPSLPTIKLGHFRCWFTGGWACVHSRIPRASPKNSPVRLGVSCPTTTPTGFSSQSLWGFISPHGDLGRQFVSLPNCSSWTICMWTWKILSTSYCLAAHPLCPTYLYPSILTVWMNVSSLTPSSDFHAISFSGSAGCFSVLNCLLSFFWLSNEATCFYLHLHLGQTAWYFLWCYWYVFLSYPS